MPDSHGEPAGPPPRPATSVTDDPRTVLDELTTALPAALGASLLGLYAHGSWVAGDFAPARSDLDLLAVLDTDPAEATLTALAPVLADVGARHLAWRGRLEVEVVGLGALRRAATAADGVASLRDHRIARVSPGELLHLLPATSHRLLTWASVRTTGVPLTGPAPAELLPSFPPAAVHGALLDHVRDWPTWARDMRSAGGQAYAVLTVCRAVRRLDHHEQLSKRGAADVVAVDLPAWAGLVRWARDWWYAGGGDGDPGRYEEVNRFVAEVSRDLLRRHDAPTR